MKKNYLLGLFGHPVEHSQSPRIHKGFAQQFGIDIDYQLIDVTTNDLANTFTKWIKTAHGCNITVPYKNAIIPLLDRLTEKAQVTQAVNTVYWQNGELWGDNTDGDGLVLDLKNKKTPLKGAQVLIIGAGGAAQGIIPSLLNEGIESIEIKNRDQNKAKNLATRFNRCSQWELAQDHYYDLIIHATSMGHHGLTPELNSTWFTTNTIAYDLSYGQACEAFLQSAQTHGANQAYDGLGMLYGQAALAFENWFGFRPEIQYNELQLYSLHQQ